MKTRMSKFKIPARVPRRVTALVAAAVIAIPGIAACSAVTVGDHGGDHGSQMMDPAGDANAADVMFVQMMIPHHEQAVDMSALAPDRASDPRVLDLAERIAAAQDPEIAQMRAMLVRWEVPEMGSGMDGMENMPMAGMVSAEDLAGLAASSGEEFDRQFLELMIAHHEGAVTMAQDAQRDGADPELRSLLDAIVTSQNAEIAEMQAILAEGSN